MFYNTTADRCETKTSPHISRSTNALWGGWVKVKKRGVLSRRFIAPIRSCAWIRCFYYAKSKQLKPCAVVKLQLWEPGGESATWSRPPTPFFVFFLKIQRMRCVQLISNAHLKMKKKKISYHLEKLTNTQSMETVIVGKNRKVFVFVLQNALRRQTDGSVAFVLPFVKVIIVFPACAAQKARVPWPWPGTEMSESALVTDERPFTDCFLHRDSLRGQHDASQMRRLLYDDLAVDKQRQLHTCDEMEGADQRWKDFAGSVTRVHIGTFCGKRRHSSEFCLATLLIVKFDQSWAKLQ